MRTLFAPGCALLQNRRASIDRMSAFLRREGLTDGRLTECCKKCQGSDERMTIVVCCPGCSRKFAARYPNASVVSLWKVLLDADFPFPDYRGEKMSIHDSCRARQRDSAEMQVSARELCRKMNIALVEPLHTREATVCCGGSAPDLVARKKMAQERAKAFSQEDVVVYCTGCTRSFSITGKRPRHLLDLLFGEPTQGLTLE